MSSSPSPAPQPDDKPSAFPQWAWILFGVLAIVFLIVVVGFGIRYLNKTSSGSNVTNQAGTWSV